MKALIIVVAAFAALIAPSAAGVAAAEAPDEARLDRLVAELRNSHGLKPLERHPQLDAKAHAWAETMAGAGRIWHSNLSDDITADWRRLGENVGMGGAVEQIHDALVRSAAHYANLTNPEFSHAGFGVAASGRGLFVAQVFMTLAPAPPTAPEPAPPAPQPAPAAEAVPAPTPAVPAPARPVPPKPRELRPLPASSTPAHVLLARAVGAAALSSAAAAPDPLGGTAPEKEAHRVAGPQVPHPALSTELASWEEEDDDDDALPGAPTVPSGLALAAIGLASGGRLVATGRRRSTPAPGLDDALSA